MAQGCLIELLDRLERDHHGAGLSVRAQASHHDSDQGRLLAAPETGAGAAVSRAGVGVSTEEMCHFRIQPEFSIVHLQADRPGRQPRVPSHGHRSAVLIDEVKGS